MLENPVIVLDAWIHKLVVKASHAIQRNLHVNRDTLVAFSFLSAVILAIASQLFALQNFRGEALKAGALFVIIFKVVCGSWGILAYWNSAADSLRMSREFEEDPTTPKEWRDWLDTPSRRPTKHFLRGYLAWIVFPWVGASCLYVVNHTYEREWITPFAWEKIFIGLTLLACVIGMHLMDSDHVHPDKRTSLSGADVPETT